MSDEAQALERIAMLYIEGLMGGDGSKVPLAPDVERSHLLVLPGMPLDWQKARGAELIRADFAREALTVRKNMRVTVDTERSAVVVIWESGMDADFARAIMIVDRFVIRDGLIQEIEIISIPQARTFGALAYAGWDKMVGAAKT